MGAIDCSIDQLLLNSENPRNESAANQRDALQKILDDQEEKLFVLAEDIVEAGLSQWTACWFFVRKRILNGSSC